MNRPTHIIIHCSDSTWGDAAVIDEWHRARGFTGIGYHYVVLNGRRTGTPYQVDADGAVEPGRAETVQGAHCLGYNARSIGICLIGRGSYTHQQLAQLHSVVRRTMARYGIPADRVLGHGEADKASGKTCPILDMGAFRASLE